MNDPALVGHSLVRVFRASVDGLSGMTPELGVFILPVHCTSLGTRTKSFFRNGAPSDVIVYDEKPIEFIRIGKHDYIPVARPHEPSGATHCVTVLPEDADDPSIAKKDNDNIASSLNTNLIDELTIISKMLSSALEAYKNPLRRGG